MKISDIDCELLGNGVEKSSIEILRYTCKISIYKALFEFICLGYCDLL